MITIIRKGVKGTMKVSETQELRDKDYVVGGASRGFVEIRNGIRILGRIKLPVISKSAIILPKIKFDYQLGKPKYNIQH